MHKKTVSSLDILRVKIQTKIYEQNLKLFQARIRNVHESYLRNFSYEDNVRELADQNIYPQLEAFVFLAGKELQVLLEKYCGLLEKADGQPLKAALKTYQKKNISEIESLLCYFKDNLKNTSETDARAWKEKLKILQRINLVRNCLIHNSGQIRNPNDVNKIKELLRGRSGCQVKTVGKIKYIELSIAYVDFLIEFYEDLVKRFNGALQRRLS